jgi:serine/threonine protein phosphatase PrpC
MTELRCAQCAEPAAATDHFCETCGHRLTAPAGTTTAPAIELAAPAAGNGRQARPAATATATPVSGPAAEPAAPPHASATGLATASATGLAAEPATAGSATGRPVPAGPVPAEPPVPGPTTGLATGPATGGPATGGPATGGPATGGPATGGAATGGAATGSPATGRVSPGEACRCGDGRADADGYCDSCGTLLGRADTWLEACAPGAALVSDRGLVHVDNEDAGAVAEVAGRTIAVVCDGVSSAPRAAEAAQTAVATAIEMLRGLPPTTPIQAGLSNAIEAAADAVEALAAAAPDGNAPACTFVAVVADPAGVLHVAHVGDSRAYWLPDSGEPCQLTVDDSWATEAIDAGLDPARAWADSRAHALTGWLGADAGSVRPHVALLPVRGPGLVVLCSDGLWNYLIELADFADRVRRAARDGADLLGCARLLVEFARSQGGRDNITVAVLRTEEAAS